MVIYVIQILKKKTLLLLLYRVNDILNITNELLKLKF